MKRVVFESNNPKPLKIMNGKEDDILRNSGGMSCRRIWKLKAKLLEMEFIHTGRKNNIATHMLARDFMRKQNTMNQVDCESGLKAQEEPLYFFGFPFI